VGLLPKVILGPLAGTLVDRWNHRKVLIFADGIVTLATILLAFLFALGLIQIWHIYILIFIRALGGAFHSPAMTASTTLLVPQKHLARIQGLNGTLGGVIGILSPILGALLLNWMSMQCIMAIYMGTALFAILPLFFIPIPQPKPAVEKQVSPIRADLLYGIRYLWSRPGLWLITLSHAVIYFLMMPAYSLIPIFVTDYLNGGAPQLAWLQSVSAVGAIVGGLLLSIWGGFRRQIVTVLLATLLSGLSWVMMGLTPASALHLAMGALFLGTAVNSVMVGSVGALWQTVIPPELQGRLFAMGITMISGMSSLGLAIAGPPVNHFGVKIWFLIGGIVTTILGIVPFFCTSYYGC
jgi:DHA3 family macrolide efflux protein-like MFS transporter